MEIHLFSRFDLWGWQRSTYSCFSIANKGNGLGWQDNFRWYTSIHRSCCWLLGWPDILRAQCLLIWEVLPGLAGSPQCQLPPGNGNPGDALGITIGLGPCCENKHWPWHLIISFFLYFTSCGRLFWLWQFWLPGCKALPLYYTLAPSINFSLCFCHPILYVCLFSIIKDGRVWVFRFRPPLSGGVGAKGISLGDHLT